MVLVTVHVAVWPALPIVPLHPSENVVARGAIMETVLSFTFVAYIFPLTGLKAMPNGIGTAGMVPTTVFVEGSITETVLLPPFVTYKSPLSGLKATPIGFVPTGMVATTNPCVGLVSVTW